jgi:hypothetical protein
MNKLALSQGMLKKGDVINDAEDDNKTCVTEPCDSNTM